MDTNYIVNQCLTYFVQKNKSYFTLQEVYDFFKSYNNNMAHDFEILKKIDMFFDCDSKENIKFCPKIDICEDYNDPIYKCNNTTCSYLHICYDIINNSSCKRVNSCILDHTLQSTHNIRLLVETGLDFRYIDVKILFEALKIGFGKQNTINLALNYVLNTNQETFKLKDVSDLSGIDYFDDDEIDFRFSEIYNNPDTYKIDCENNFKIDINIDICRDYLTDSCVNSECEYLHICEDELLHDNCFWKNTCNFIHSLNDDHNLGILCNIGLINADRELLLKYLKYKKNCENIQNQFSKKYSQSDAKVLQKKLLELNKNLIDSLKLNIDEYYSTLSDYEKEILNLVDERSKYIDDYEYEIQNLNGQISDLLDENRFLKDEIEKYKKTSAQIELDKKTIPLQNEIDKLRNHNNTLKSEISNLNIKISKLDFEKGKIINEYQLGYDDYEFEIEQLKQENVKLKAQLSFAVKDESPLKHTISNMTQELEDKEKLIKKLQKQIVMLSEGEL